IKTEKDGPGEKIQRRYGFIPLKYQGPTARAKVAKADEKTPKSEGATETESIAHFYVVQTLG
ncbi:hypothetical protein Gotri_000154, partial [Gossypium trilobum]|nr:hypothetical protein [Gossypium trilobum]